MNKNKRTESTSLSVTMDVPITKQFIIFKNGKECDDWLDPNKCTVLAPNSLAEIKDQYKFKAIMDWAHMCGGKIEKITTVPEGVNISICFGNKETFEKFINGSK